jgi:hypothetical protein
MKREIAGLDRASAERILRRRAAMKLGFFPLLVTLAVGSAFAACGGSTTNGNSTPAQDGGTTTDEGGTGDDVAPDAGDEAAPPPLDHGMPSTTYPAFKADMPQLNKNGGNILTAPVVVPVTWDTDPNQAALDSFTAGIGASDYWKAVVSEYGVGAAIAGTPVHIPVTTASPLPTTLSTDDLDGLVDTGAGGGGTWTPPTAQTIYILYLHPSIAVTAGGSPACSSFGGYHSVSQQGNYIYAIALPCATGSGILPNLTVTGSHEIGEASTDPLPGGGYTGFDNNHISWTLFQHGQTENGDACEFYSDAEEKELAPFAFTVQRLWSNAAAAAGHNPCVPAAAGTYFGVTPTALETVAYAGRQGSTIMTKGINIAVGMTKTFPVGFFSDAASGAWSIRAAEGFTPGVGGPTTPHLSVSVDKTSGQNGEIAYVTVTVNKAGSTIGTRTYAKANYVTMLSSLGNSTHFMPILITNN